MRIIERKACANDADGGPLDSQPANGAARLATPMQADQNERLLLRSQVHERNV